jgi:NAD(P)-dependent dehydrogenase (short-subunit alcohol dehydrogenase family)
MTGTQHMPNPTILVTGAANDIGRAASKALAESGATVILLDNDVAGLESLYDEIEAASFPQAAIYPMDLTGATGEDYEQLADTVADNFGQLDGLLHCAAILGVMSRVDDYDIENWFKVMQTNLNAPFLLTRALLPLLRKSQAASILFCDDGLGSGAKAYQGAYGVSKAGSKALMSILADELENSSIRVNSYDPGNVATELRRQAFPAEDADSLVIADDAARMIVDIMNRHDSHGKHLPTQD